jgi:hypothetical protein
MSLVVEVDVGASQPVTVVSTHLEDRSPVSCRRDQMRRNAEVGQVRNQEACCGSSLLGGTGDSLVQSRVHSGHIVISVQSLEKPSRPDCDSHTADRG